MSKEEVKEIVSALAGACVLAVMFYVMTVLMFCM